MVTVCAPAPPEPEDALTPLLRVVSALLFAAVVGMGTGFGLMQLLENTVVAALAGLGAAMLATYAMLTQPDGPR